MVSIQSKGVKLNFVRLERYINLQRLIFVLNGTTDKCVKSTLQFQLFVRKMTFNYLLSFCV